MSLPGVNVLTALSIAYLDRLAAGDVTRASIVLAKLSEVYPDTLPDLAAATGRSIAQLPARIPDIWDGSVREIVRFALPVPAGNATVSAVVMQIGGTQVVSQLPALARRYLEYIPESNPARQFAGRVATADIGSMPQVLDALIAGVLTQGAVPNPTPGVSSRIDPRLFRSASFFVPRSDLQSMLASAGRGTSNPADQIGGANDPSPITLPDIPITGQTSQSPSSFPIWGYAVIAGLVLGTGFFVYRRYYSTSPP